MYYVNREGIERRLRCIPDIAEAAGAVSGEWTGSLLEGLAQERCLHLALEIVTDVGSFLIDGFMMRDASSYEDIVEVIAGEGVVPADRAETLRRLVALRKPLVQDYDNWPRREPHRLTAELPDLLLAFEADVNAFLKRELDPWETPR
ncbi:DUF86 domain-containing protein [Cohnella nanjingensis]|uniref:DUF86 domain-containing protein n=1 Tax=Cohnella nanjingensis TaxID=1387779 RepID=A0A7X0RUD6_9BACL|nr:HepT-like ribonuclease domain-containing protein [Cohnella nanjingensis]MBB6673859.1 DUF86 domain-containing protein [Cohnella nanjingensis]